MGMYCITVHNYILYHVKNKGILFYISHLRRGGHEVISPLVRRVYPCYPNHIKGSKIVCARLCACVCAYMRECDPVVCVIIRAIKLEIGIQLT